MVKQEVRGETVVMRCDCGKLMEIKRKGGIRWECSRCGFVLPLSHLTPMQPEGVAPVQPLAGTKGLSD